MKYKCLHPFIISNTTLQYSKGQIIGQREFDCLPWGYKPYFSLVEEKATSNAVVIGDFEVK